MTLSQLLLALRARAAIILLTLVVTFATALVVSLVMQKQYVASAAVVVDVKSLDPVAGTVLPGLLQPGYMATQIDIVNSGRVAQRVVKALRLEQDPGWKRAWLEADEGQGDFTVWAANVLHSKLDAKPSKESNVINIGFTGTNPVFVAAVANAFTQAFVDVDLELKIEPARQYATWFDEQTKRARDQLEETQKRLSAYRQESGIVTSDEKLDAENAKIGDISSQLTQLQAQIADSQSKRTSGGTGTTAEAMQSPVISGLKADIARLDAKLQESNGNLGKNHPQTLRTQAELASLRAQLASEVGQIGSSFDTAYRVGKQREKDLQAALANQKSDVLQLNKQRDELNVLRNDVDSAQRAFEAVSQRAAQTHLESQSSQTNVMVLTTASVPLRPAKPRILLNLAAATLGGLALGMGLALLLELRNRRVRSTEDMNVMSIPVLASIGTVERLANTSWHPRKLLGREFSTGR